MSQLPQLPQQSRYPLPGEVIEDKYRVEHLLGEGGMGAVAKATHLLRRAPVALKFMSPAVLAMHGAVQRFVNEGVAASQIDCDNVVKVFDVGRLPSGAPYLVMEYLDGLDLGQLLRRDGGRLEVHRAVHFALQALRALQAAHAAGIIHRDMKPSNCFVLERDGEADFVKLVDFGISKVLTDDPGKSASLTHTNSALGTPMYMAPEQARSPRDVDYRADLYSVGAILYESLTGRPPYIAPSGEYAELLYKIFTTEPDPVQGFRGDVSDGLAAVVHKALTRDPAARFSSAFEMAEALAPFADERSAQVLARLRGGHARSMFPPAGRVSVTPPRVTPSAAPPPMAVASVPPPARASVVPTSVASLSGARPGPAYAQAAVAQTFPVAPGSQPISKGATHVGLARDARTAPGTGARRTVLAVGGVGAVVIALGAAGLVAMRRPVSARPEPMVSVPPAVSVAPPAPTESPEAAVAVQAPDAAPTPSAGASSARAAVKPPASATPRDNKTPSTLGGIQLH